MENKTEKTSAYSSLLPGYKIEGFDPNSVLTETLEIDENGQAKESLFMRYLPALEWFLTIYPDGCLNHVFIERSDRKASVTASIYRRQEDVRPAATATCSTYYDESLNGKYYEQNAVTAAYRKALGYLGFGTPLDAVKVDGIKSEISANIPEKTESGVMVKVSTPPVIENCAETDASSANAPKKPRIKKEKILTADATLVPDALLVTTPVHEHFEPEENSEEKEISEDEVLFNVVAEAQPQPAPAPVAVSKPALPTMVQSVPNNLEEALEIIVTKGTAVGQTIREAAKSQGNSFIRWHCDKAKINEPGSPFAVATQLFCEFNGC